MKNNLKIFSLLIFLMAPTMSFAAVYGGSNLGFGGYPEFTEVAPTPPYTHDQYAWESYRQEVEDYTRKAKQYVEDADSDIKRVQEAQQYAIEKANAVVQEYNRQ